MKIRTQLVLACFLLSIVPLAAIVLYSYQSSRQALETAYHNETARTTRQMDRRLAAIRTDLQERLAELTAFPLQIPKSNNPGTDRHVENDVMLALGDSARLIDSLEFQPIPEVRAETAPSPAPKPATGHVSHPSGASAARHRAPKAEVADGGPTPPTPPNVPEAALSPKMTPIVIDIPRVPTTPIFPMTAEQQERLHEIGKLATRLSRNDFSSPQQRIEVEKELRATQSEFTAEMTRARVEMQKELAEQNSKLREQSRQFRNFAAEQRRIARLDKKTANDEPAIAATDIADAASAAAAGAAPPAVEAAGAEPTSSAGDPPAPGVLTEARKIIVKHNVTPEEVAAIREHQKRVALVFGKELKVPVRRDGTVVANLSAQVRLEEVLRRVLGNGSDDGEVAFAADRDGNIYTRTPADRRTLDTLGVSKAVVSGQPLPKPANWVISMTKDAESGVRVGVARPVGGDLGELRRAAAVNFSAGIALILVALVGIVPVANHITRDVKLVTAGAERIAHGDLTTRVPIKSHNEFGQLASAFNKMAADLSHHQQTIIEQERTRKEQELHQRMLAMEYSRKSVELEEARRFQLSMLPKELPAQNLFDVAVFTETATEVGGDYYDFHLGDGVMSVAVGDATGHGAKAGTMITVAKTLFASYSAGVSPSAFLSDAAEKIKRMDFSRMAMSLLLAQFSPRQLRIAAAGMPPALIRRAATGSIEEIAASSTPLGTLGSDYADRVIDLAKGDTVLLLTDGFPELLNASGHQLGYPAALEAFSVASAATTAAGVIEALSASARQWRGAQAPNDDVTFVVVRVI